MGQTVVFRIGQEPTIPVDIMDINGTWVTVPMLVDTGNATTIVDVPTAQNLLRWNMEGDYQRQVKAVFGEPQTTAVSEQVYIKIGNTMPIETNIIIAPTDSGNLLGFDIMQRFFKITFDGDSIIMEQRDDCSACVNDQQYIPEFENYTQTSALWGEQGWHEMPYAGSPDYTANTYEVQLVDGADIEPIHLDNPKPSTGNYFYNT